MFQRRDGTPDGKIVFQTRPSSQTTPKPVDCDNQVEDVAAKRQSTDSGEQNQPLHDGRQRGLKTAPPSHSGRQRDSCSSRYRRKRKHLSNLKATIAPIAESPFDDAGLITGPIIYSSNEDPMVALYTTDFDPTRPVPYISNAGIFHFGNMPGKEVQEYFSSCGANNVPWPYSYVWKGLLLQCMDGTGRYLYQENDWRLPFIKQDSCKRNATNESGILDGTVPDLSASVHSNSTEVELAPAIDSLRIDDESQDVPVVGSRDSSNRNLVYSCTHISDVGSVFQVHTSSVRSAFAEVVNAVHNTEETLFDDPLTAHCIEVEEENELWEDLVFPTVDPVQHARCDIVSKDHNTCDLDVQRDGWCKCVANTPTINLSSLTNTFPPLTVIQLLLRQVNGDGLGLHPNLRLLVTHDGLMLKFNDIYILQAALDEEQMFSYAGPGSLPCQDEAPEILYPQEDLVSPFSNVQGSVLAGPTVIDTEYCDVTDFSVETMLQSYFGKIAKHRIPLQGDIFTSCTEIRQCSHGLMYRAFGQTSHFLLPESPYRDRFIEIMTKMYFPSLNVWEQPTSVRDAIATFVYMLARGDFCAHSVLNILKYNTVDNQMVTRLEAKVEATMVRGRVVQTYNRTQAKRILLGILALGTLPLSTALPTNVPKDDWCTWLSRVMLVCIFFRIFKREIKEEVTPLIRAFELAKCSFDPELGKSVAQRNSLSMENIQAPLLQALAIPQLAPYLAKIAEDEPTLSKIEEIVYHLSTLLAYHFSGGAKNGNAIRNCLMTGWLALYGRKTAKSMLNFFKTEESFERNMAFDFKDLFTNYKILKGAPIMKEFRGVLVKTGLLALGAEEENKSSLISVIESVMHVESLTEAVFGFIFRLSEVILALKNGVSLVDAMGAQELSDPLYIDTLNTMASVCSCSDYLYLAQNLEILHKKYTKLAKIHKNPQLNRALVERLTKILGWKEQYSAAIRIGQYKPQPFAVCINGVAGIGKTVTSQNFMKLVIANHNLRIGPIREIIGVHVPQDKYHSTMGSDTSGAILDDLGYEPPNNKSSGDIPKPGVLLAQFNGSVYMPWVKSESSEKGNQINNLKYLLITTNKDDAWVRENVTDPNAATRRLGITVEMFLKKWEDVQETIACPWYNPATGLPIPENFPPHEGGFCKHCTYGVYAWTSEGRKYWIKEDLDSVEILDYLLNSATTYWQRILSYQEQPVSYCDLCRRPVTNGCICYRNVDPDPEPTQVWHDTSQVEPLPDPPVDPLNYFGEYQPSMQSQLIPLLDRSRRLTKPAQHNMSPETQEGLKMLAKLHDTHLLNICANWALPKESVENFKNNFGQARPLVGFLVDRLSDISSKVISLDKKEEMHLSDLARFGEAMTSRLIYAAGGVSAASIAYCLFKLWESRKSYTSLADKAVRNLFAGDDPPTIDQRKATLKEERPWATVSRNKLTRFPEASSRGINFLLNDVRKCWFSAYIENLPGRPFTHGFMVCEGFLVLPAHAWGIATELKLSLTINKFDSQISVFRENTVINSEHDVSMSYVGNFLGSRPDIIKYFSQEEIGVKHVVTAVLGLTDPIRTYDTSINEVTDQFFTDGKITKVLVYASDYAKGDCGLPLLYGDEKFSMIVGLHCGFHTGTNICLAVPITKSVLLDMRTQLRKSINVLLTTEKKELFTVPGVNRVLEEEIHPKNLANFIPQDITDHVEFWGDITKDVTPKTSTRVHPWKHVSELLYDLPKLVPAIMTNETLREMTALSHGVGVCLYPDSLKYALTSISEGFQDMIEQYAKDRAEEERQLKEGTITEALLTNYKWLDGPYDGEDIINGVPGNLHRHGMKMDTSAGEPFRTKARMIFDINDQAQYVFKPEVQASHEAYVQRVRAGIYGGTIMRATQKDEAREPEKAKLPRVFQSPCKVQHVEISRWMGPLCDVCCLYPDMSGCAVGISSHSVAWENTIGSIDNACLNGHVLEYDVSKFDLSLPNELRLGVFKVMARASQNLLNFSDEDLEYVERLLFDLVSPLVAVNGAVLNLPGLWTSGNSLTAAVGAKNGETGVRYNYYEGKKCYLRLGALPTGDVPYPMDFDEWQYAVLAHKKAGKTVDEIKTIIAPRGTDGFLIDTIYFLDKPFVDDPHDIVITSPTFQCDVPMLRDDRRKLYFYGLGDDAKVKVFAEWFDQFVLEYYFRKLGMKITSASKGAIVASWVEPLESVFLQRDTRWCREKQHAVGRLGSNSILKPLCVMMPSKSISMTEQICDQIRSVLLESIYHGREAYEAVRERLFVLCREMNLIPPKEVELNYDDKWLAMGVQVHHCTYGCLSCAIGEKRWGHITLGSDLLARCKPISIRNVGSGITQLDAPAGVESSVAPTNMPVWDYQPGSNSLSFDRLFTVDTLTIDLNTPLYKRYDCYNILGDDYLKQRLSYISGVMCDFKYHFMLSGSGAHYGELLVTSMPARFLMDFQDEESLASNLRVCLQTSREHVRMSMEPDRSQATLVVPTVYSGPMLFPNKDTFYSPSIMISTLCNFKHALGSLSPVTLKIMVELVNVRCSGNTSVPNIMEHSEPTSGTLAVAGENLAGVADLIGSGLPQYAVPAEIAAKALRAGSNIARRFGFSRPGEMGFESSVVHSTPPLSNTDMNLFGLKKLSMAHDQGVATLDLFREGLEDPLTFASMLEYMPVVDRWEWDTSQVQGTVLRRYAVTPTQFVTDGNLYVPTPGCVISWLNKKYHGTMEFLFDVVAPESFGGKLEVWYEPQVGADPANFSSATNPLYILDLRHGRRLTVIVGWGVNYYANNTVGTTLTSFTENKFIDGEHNGSLTFKVSTPLNTMNGDMASVMVVCASRPAKNMLWFEPINYLANFQVYNKLSTTGQSLRPGPVDAGGEWLRPGRILSRPSAPPAVMPTSTPFFSSLIPTFGKPSAAPTDPPHFETFTLPPFDHLVTEAPTSIVTLPMITNSPAVPASLAPTNHPSVRTAAPTNAPSFSTTSAPTVNTGVPSTGTPTYPSTTMPSSMLVQVPTIPPNKECPATATTYSLDAVFGNALILKTSGIPVANQMGYLKNTGSALVWEWPIASGGGKWFDGMTLAFYWGNTFNSGPQRSSNQVAFRTNVNTLEYGWTGGNPNPSNEMINITPTPQKWHIQAMADGLVNLNVGANKYGRYGGWALYCVAIKSAEPWTLTNYDSRPFVAYAPTGLKMHVWTVADLVVFSTTTLSPTSFPTVGGGPAEVLNLLEGEELRIPSTVDCRGNMPITVLVNGSIDIETSSYNVTEWTSIPELIHGSRDYISVKGGLGGAQILSAQTSISSVARRNVSGNTFVVGSPTQENAVARICAGEYPASFRQYLKMFRQQPKLSGMSSVITAQYDTTFLNLNILEYIYFSFVGIRGSMTTLFTIQDPNTTLIVTRDIDASNGSCLDDYSARGFEHAYGAHTSTLLVNNPFYSGESFLSIRSPDVTVYPENSINLLWIAVKDDGTASSDNINRAVCVGEDFSVSHFCGFPVLERLSCSPASGPIAGAP
jgi:hypothetical protein